MKEHFPTTKQSPAWKVVSYNSSCVTVSASCECGDPDCGFSATVYEKDFVHMPTRITPWKVPTQKRE